MDSHLSPLAHNQNFRTHNAAGLALAFTVAGEDPQSLRLYDDSLNGWLSDPGLPLEKGQGRGIFIR
ncbi:hypothetical protein AAGR22_11065 [Erwinia sp. HDF1-3R]|uniref:hypothetical protein n=1 Tax=Erwinia sp. HDF1-3R TaxID=3141543 RepID=UPI0031F59439